MAHEVSITLPEVEIFHKDVEVAVRADGSSLGTILISKGNLEWVPAGNSANKLRMSWRRFAELMAEEGEAARIA